MTDPKILSVCMTLPSRQQPTEGIFVYRRLQAIKTHLSVKALRPQPWFPLLKPAFRAPPEIDPSVPIESPRMFYIPGIAKWLDARWMENALLTQVRKECENDTPVILDAHFGYPEGVACERLAKRLGIPFVVTLRGVEHDWANQRLVRPQLAQCLDAASAVIAVSESLAEVATSLGVSESRLSVIPNGCDKMVFHPGEKQAARAELGLASHRHLIVSVARIHPVKGQDVLLKALSMLPKGLEFDVILIGSESVPSFSRKIRGLIEELELNDRVRMLNPVPPETVARYLQAADLFALASHREGCCNAILEALACHTPVVATAVGDNPRFAKRYRNIEIVPPADPLAFKETVEHVLCGADNQEDSAKSLYAPQSWDEVGRQCAAVFRNINSAVAATNRV